METDQPSNSESFNTDLNVSNNQVIDLTSETFIQEVIEKSKSLLLLISGRLGVSLVNKLLQFWKILS